MSTVKQPASALSSPRFCNTGTFMRMSKVDSAQGLDFVIAGAPFDTASSFRSGSRFGPQAIRAISAMMKPNNVILQVNIMESLKGGDIGDFNITPGYIHPSYKAIEEGVAGILQENAIPIVLGGDHSITLAELRAVAKKHGPGTPEVGGFTSFETLDMLRKLKDLNYIGFDVVEVLPAYDHGEITSYMAANIVFEFLSILAAKKK